jgi:hypothetical protein
MTTNAEALRRLRTKRIAAGQCIQCSTPASRSMCDACVARARANRLAREKRDGGASKQRRREQVQALRDKRRELGQCADCAAPSGINYLCAGCRENANYKRKLREVMKDEVACG